MNTPLQRPTHDSGCGEDGALVSDCYTRAGDHGAFHYRLLHVPYLRQVSAFVGTLRLVLNSCNCLL